MKIALEISRLPSVPEHHPLACQPENIRGRLAALAEMTGSGTVEEFIAECVFLQAEMLEKDMIFSYDGRVIGDAMDDLC